MPMMSHMEMLDQARNRKLRQRVRPRRHGRVHEPGSGAGDLNDGRGTGLRHRHGGLEQRREVVQQQERRDEVDRHDALEVVAALLGKRRREVLQACRRALDQRAADARVDDQYVQTLELVPHFGGEVLHLVLFCNVARERCDLDGGVRFPDLLGRKVDVTLTSSDDNNIGGSGCCECFSCSKADTSASSCYEHNKRTWQSDRGKVGRSLWFVVYWKCKVHCFC